MASLATRGAFASIRTLLLLSAFKPALAQDLGVQHDICADFNTADMDRHLDIYQTNGACKDFCEKDYAYAITQEQSCWCSNYTPDKDTQVDHDRCDIDCPAYPVEKCGGRGLYAYIELNGHLPSGTKGGDDETSSTTSSSSSEETTDPPETTKVQTTVTTDDGSIRTVTIVHPPTDNADGSNGNESSDDGGLDTGGIVGIAVGVIGAVLIGAGIALWFFLKKRKQSKEESAYQDDPSVRGSSSDRMGSSIHPEMAVAAGSAASGGHNSNRNSTLQIDPRMDPFKKGLYGQNGSHESLNTLRDDHDYSRRILRATNPDPDAN